MKTLACVAVAFLLACSGEPVEPHAGAGGAPGSGGATGAGGAPGAGGATDAGMGVACFPDDGGMAPPETCHCPIAADGTFVNQAPCDVEGDNCGNTSWCGMSCHCIRPAADGGATPPPLQWQCLIPPCILVMP